MGHKHVDGKRRKTQIAKARQREHKPQPLSRAQLQAVLAVDEADALLDRTSPLKTQESTKPVKAYRLESHEQQTQVQTQLLKAGRQMGGNQAVEAWLLNKLKS